MDETKCYVFRNSAVLVNQSSHVTQKHIFPRNRTPSTIDYSTKYNLFKKRSLAKRSYPLQGKSKYQPWIIPRACSNVDRVVRLLYRTVPSQFMYWVGWIPWWETAHILAILRNEGCRGGRIGVTASVYTFLPALCSLARFVWIGPALY